MPSNETSYGCTWTFRPRTEIQLLMASHYYRREFWPDFRNCYDCWSLCYHLVADFRMKIGETGKWKTNGTFVMHAIPPLVPFWEDDSAIPASIPLVESFGLAFRVNEAVGLHAMIPPSRGFLEFHDPLHLLVEPITNMTVLGQSGGNLAHWDAVQELSSILFLMRKAKRLSSGVYELLAPQRSTPLHPLVQDVHKYLQEHLAESLSIPAMARDLHISTSTLTHRYKAETGETPLKTHLRLRIEKAKRLLMNRQSFKAVAEQTGFCDEFHFSRKFRQLEGVPPSTFVHMVREQAPTNREPRS